MRVIKAGHDVAKEDNREHPQECLAGGPQLRFIQCPNLRELSCERWSYAFLNAYDKRRTWDVMLKFQTEERNEFVDCG